MVAYNDIGTIASDKGQMQMSDEPTNEASQDKTVSRGFANGCVVAAVAALLIPIALFAVSQFRSEPSKVTMDVEISLSYLEEAGIDSESCDATGRVITISADDEKLASIELGEGEVAAPGMCLLKLTVEVPKSDAYTFAMPGTDLPRRTIQASAMGEDGDTMRATVWW